MPRGWLWTIARDFASVQVMSLILRERHFHEHSNLLCSLEGAGNAPARHGQRPHAGSLCPGSPAFSQVFVAISGSAPGLLKESYHREDDAAPARPRQTGGSQRLDRKDVQWGED